MANEEHLAILKQGVEVWNKWRWYNLDVHPDLVKAHLNEANLIGMRLNYADLRDADLRDANLTGANLTGADLTGANLTEANLTGTAFGDAHLTSTNLSRADLQNADFTSAFIERTIFVESDLSVAEGLNFVHHGGPSSIGIDTLYKSSGNIPESFLRGCGLNEWEIEIAKLYNPDLSNEEINNIQYRIHDLRVSRAFQINPLFISYSHSDISFVDMIEEHLIEQGILFWRDIHHVTAGRLETQIDRAINLNDIVLLILSEHSVNSDWVEHEARKARDKERRVGKDALCPVALDDSWKTCRWPERLREQIMEYSILDFSNWQDQNQFDKMFAKLIHGLAIFYK